MLLMVSCVSEIDLPQNTEGQGMFALSLAAAGQGNNVETRADDESWQKLTPTEAASYKITLIKDSETIWGPKLLSSVTTSDCTQPVGTGYSVSAESCTATEAESANGGWGQRRYYGKSSSFSITKNDTTKVRVNCHIANAGLCVLFDESFTSYFTLGYSVTTDDGRALRFDETTADNVAYYNIPDGATHTVHLFINASAGWDGILNIEKNLTLKAGTITRLNVKLNTEDPTGNVGITITIDTEFSNTDENLVIEEDI